MYTISVGKLEGKTPLARPRSRRGPLKQRARKYGVHV
jgi:hypothetical protein